MTGTELETLRHLLFFSVSEASQLVGRCAERTWRDWRLGHRSVPADVANLMRHLADWRESAIINTERAILEIEERHGEAAADLVFCFYLTAEDFCTLSGREPIYWRPHWSVVAEFVARGHRVVPFIRDAYFEWLGERGDSEAMRAAWAADIAR